MVFAISMLCIISSCSKHTDRQIIPEPVFTHSHTLVAEPSPIGRFNGYYIALPVGYDSSIKKYPLLVFLHGLGQRGNGKGDLSYLLFDGIGKVLKDDRLPAEFSVQGENFSLMIVSPQYSDQPNAEDVMQFIDTIVARYRVRTNRIYISGLSLGSRIATLTAGKYPQRFSAIVPIAGVATNDSMNVRCEKIAENNLPVWAFHNVDDPMSDVNDSRVFVDYIKDYQPPVQPRLTVFDQYGHDAWTKALDTAYRENGSNVYEWMLQYFR
jgi:predicted peptidase